MKCWNLSNNLASWNYLVMEKVWRNATCPTIIISRNENHPTVQTGQQSLSTGVFYWVKSVSLQSCSTDLSYKSLARNQAAHYSVSLSHCSHSSPLFMSAWHGPVGFEWQWSFLHSLYAYFVRAYMHIPLCSYTFQFPPSHLWVLS